MDRRYEQSIVHTSNGLMRRREIGGCGPCNTGTRCGRSSKRGCHVCKRLSGGEGGDAAGAPLRGVRVGRKWDGWAAQQCAGCGRVRFRDCVLVVVRVLGVRKTARHTLETSARRVCHQQIYSGTATVTRTAVEMKATLED